jgi:hypothetical protein
MEKWFSNFVCLALAISFIDAGCEQTYTQQTEPLAVEQSAEVELSGFAAQTVNATGGLSAWRKTKGLQLNCVVAFYQPDKSYYLTEQRYEIYPWSNSIRVSTLEPQNMFVWRLTKGQFNILEGGQQFEGMADAVGSRCLAESILNIVTAPARFLDASVDFVREATPVKMHGQWYYLINRKNKANVLPADRLTEAIFYQNRENFAIDMIWFPRMNGNQLLMVRGYDYETVENGGVLIPARIEIYRTDALGISQELLVKIDCSDIKCN